MAKWFGLVRGWCAAAETNTHQLILKSISNFSYQLVKCVSAAAHQPLTKPNQLATKLLFFIFRFISPIYLISPLYFSIEVNKIAFWLFWYLFFLKLVWYFVQFHNLKISTSRGCTEVGRPGEAPNSTYSFHINSKEAFYNLFIGKKLVTLTIPSP